MILKINTKKIYFRCNVLHNMTVNLYTVESCCVEVEGTYDFVGIIQVINVNFVNNYNEWTISMNRVYLLLLR